jgi:chromosome segregation ATPase
VAEKRAELERLAGELADQQAVLTEQRARFDAERRQWKSDEARTVAELEPLARDLDAREQLLTAKIAAVDRTVAALKDREQELSRFQTKLERWQIALTNHEVRTAAERDQAKAALVAKQAELAERESNLAEVCRVWSEIRIREREALQIELTRWADERQQFNEALTALDRQRQELLAAAGRVAALAVSLEESRQEWERIVDSPKAVRRLRVLRRRWESRFRRYSKELTRRQEMLIAETTALNDRYRSLHCLLTEVTEKRAELAAAEQSAELAKKTTPALPDDDGEPVILSLAEARRERSEEELRAIRADVERMAASIRRADDNAGLVRLCPAA